MSGNKEWFTDLNEGFKQTVKLGNDSRIVMTRIGSVRLCVNGIVQVITNVYYIPELKNNLLSIGQLQEKGLTVLIQNSTCKVFHPSRGLIMHSDMSGNRMFYFLAKMVCKFRLMMNHDYGIHGLDISTTRDSELLHIEEWLKGCLL